MRNQKLYALSLPTLAAIALTLFALSQIATNCSTPCAQLLIAGTTSLGD